jgi:hypothetical protein
MKRNILILILFLANSTNIVFAQLMGGLMIPQPAYANQYPSNSVFCDDFPTAIVEVLNPTTGRTWMDRNLGALQAATSRTDAKAFGYLYQWGRRSDGHQCRGSATTPFLSSIDQPSHGNFITTNSGNFDWRSPQNPNLWQGVNGVNNPCPIDFRLPTSTELEAERLSWSTRNAAGAFASPLKWALTGHRGHFNGAINNAGKSALYWSSSVDGTSSKHLDFDSSFSGILTPNGRAWGMSVRCIKQQMPFSLSGGTETSVGSETVLTFNNSGTLTVTGTGPVRILVVGGGGGGRSGKSNNGNTGGGGGRVIEQFLTLNPGTYTVTVGAAGSANGGNGSSSSISGVTLTASGGLGNGTSGSGFGVGSAVSNLWGGAASCFTSSSGGGSTGNGQAGSSGSGIDNNITGTTTQYGYGGSGGAYDASLTYTCIGSGGGNGWISWNNGSPTPRHATPNFQNRGHGGNGGGHTRTLSANSSAGSRGVIIIRYTKIL